MTIVASNSLTISNVNDGTITHTAYAYSADGKDRFTNVYPNLNLLKNTKSQSHTSTGVAENTSSFVYLLDGVISDMLNKPLTITYNYEITNSSGTWSGTIRPTYGLGGTNQSVSNTNLSGTHKETINVSGIGFDSYRLVTSGLPAGTKVTIINLKLEFGSIATPYMPSVSEAKTTDYPSYRGEYSDFSDTASTDPAKYAPWTIFKGNDGKDGANGKDGIAGKDGVGIKTTDITYAISTSGTTAPTTGWTSSVPSLVKGQYLWTKTVWTYTDNSSETGYSVTYISKDGKDGSDGIAGKDGVGIKSTTITYAKSTSGTTQPTTGWTSTVPTVPAGQFLWTKTVWEYTDSTSETGYSVSKMGNDGKPGEDGQDGQDGESSWNILFEKDSYVLPANSLGAVTSYEGTGTSLKVVLGNGTLLTPVSNAAVPKDPGTFTMKPTAKENIVTGAGKVDTENKELTYSNVSKMDSNSDTASITYTIWVNVSGVVTTIVKVQRFTKSQKGLTGDPGADSHSYFMYSANADGSKMVSQPDADTKYIGVCSTSATTAPTNPSSYTWSKYVGQDAFNPVGDNLVANPNFDGLKIDDTLYLPTLYFKDHYQWQAYQDIPKLVAPESDSPSSMIIRCDVTNRAEASTAALSPFIPVKPGERYIIGADIRWTGNGKPSDQYNLNLRFFPTTINTDKRMTTGQTGNNGFGFIGKKGNNTIQTSDKPSINRWNACWAIVEIPDDGTGYISPAWYSNDKKFVIDYRNVYVKRVEKASISKLDSEPLGKYPGQIWQYTGTSPITVGSVAIQPNTQYIWNGTKWELYAIYSNNMVIQNGFITNAMIANAAIDFAKINSATIKNLSAITAILGDVYAGKITNEFDYKGDDGKQYTGTTVYDSYKILMDYTIDGQGGMTLSLSPEGLIIKGNTGETGGSYALDLTKGGLRIDAGPLGNVDLTPGGLVFSSDTKLATLPLNGVVTASVKYIKKNGVVYVTGAGNWGNFPDNKSRTMGNIPAGFRPPASWGAGMNSQGGKRLMSVAVGTDGNLTVTSDAAQNNVYGQFSMSYPVD